ncbi:MAG: WYL domain-containing protein [Pasteurella oralis]|uniref:helix-turn-helix transcriptional regulator n=1 Tax=Pasteurella oralis TaxID=1071947 RepID=UPI002700623D|nr:WYL domain-containing protein [Pasteurella oralis]
MPKRPSDVDLIPFYLEILTRIPKGAKVSASELHEQLVDAGYDRDIRTVQRVLKQLVEKFDIECDDRNKPYGYRWKERSQGLGLPVLSVQQSLVLTLAEQQLKHLLPANIMASMKPFFDQATRTVAESKNKPEYQWLGKICSVPSSQPLIPAQIDNAVLDAVSTALFQNKWLTIHYQNQSGKSYQARVMPLAMAQMSATIYLVVRYENFDDTRMLALHRIKQAEVSTMSFERPQDFDLKQYQAEGHFGFGGNEKIRLRFSIDHQAGFHLTETPLSEDQMILQESEDHYRFQATVIDNDMLTWWLRRFGDDIWDIEKEPI